MINNDYRFKIRGSNNQDGYGWYYVNYIIQQQLQQQPLNVDRGDWLYVVTVTMITR